MERNGDEVDPVDFLRAVLHISPEDAAKAREDAAKAMEREASSASTKDECDGKWRPRPGE